MPRQLVAWSLRLLGVVAALALTALPAAADDDALQRAQSLYNDATTALAAKKYDEAADAFKQAYDAKPIVDLLYNIGATYHLKARDNNDIAAYELAQQYYQKYLDAAPDSPDKDEIDKRLDVIKAEIERLKATPADATPPPPPPAAAAVEVKPRSLVVIETEPQGANIYLDDKSKGVFAQSPWSGSLDGQHKVIIEKRGHKSKESTLVPDPNRLVVLQVVLAEEDYLGWVEIKSNVPGASIFADDKSVGAIGVTPFSGNFKPGKHTIWITADGYDEFKQDIDVVAGEAGEVDAQLNGSPVGYLNIRDNGQGTTRVAADGQRLCDRLPCREPLREGKHKVVLSRSGYKPYRATLDFQPHTEITLRPTLMKKPGRGDAVAAYIFAVLLAGGGTAAYYYANHVEPGDTLYDNRKYVKYGAYGGWALGGLVGLTAIYYTFRDKGPPSTATVDIRSIAIGPAAAPGFGGLSVAGSF
ncbi:MAG TPA: PEGA domain-containing protein [Kofleriaceae bacterium]|nr:PEGA domain-containing protein [Kofleriaceae bacterium]